MADQIPTPNAFTPDMQAQFNDLMALSTGRAQRQEPVHQAAMAMATRMAPSYARDAMTAPRQLQSGPGGTGGTSIDTSGGSGGDAAQKAALAALLAAVLRGGSGGIADLFKKLFGGGTPSVKDLGPVSPDQFIADPPVKYGTGGTGGGGFPNTDPFWGWGPNGGQLFPGGPGDFTAGAGGSGGSEDIPDREWRHE